MSRTRITLLTTAFAVLGALLLIGWFVLAAALIPLLVTIILDFVAVALYVGGLVAVAGYLSDETGFTAWDIFKLRLRSTETWERISNHPTVALGLLGSVMVIAIAVLIISQAGGSSGEAPKPPAQAIDRPLKPAAAQPIAAPPTPTARLITDPTDIQVMRTNNFAWPAPGSIAKLFGPDPDGIDINLIASPDNYVTASSRGIVSFAGPSAGGFSVEVDHGNGLSTLYSSLAQAVVKTGDHVEKGTDVGVAGPAGQGGPRQLHFEVRVAGQKVDPLRYLPSTQFGLSASVPQALKCPADLIIADPNSSLSVVYSADFLSYYSILDIRLSPTGAGAPAIVALPKGLLRTSMDFPPLGESMKPTEYLMAATLSRGAERIEVDCRVVVQPAATVPDLPKLVQDAEPPPLVLDTPVQPIPPAAPAAATATATPTKKAGTMTPVATGTPPKPQPTKPSALPPTSTPANRH